MSWVFDGDSTKIPLDYIGLDVHKKDKIGATRYERDSWMNDE